MHDLYLRAADEAAAMAALADYTAPVPTSDGANAVRAWVRASAAHALDPVGALVDVPATLDPETGAVLAPATYLPGFHVNLRLVADVPARRAAIEAVAAAGAIEILAPAAPRRVFA